MPQIDLSPSAELFYRDDDFTDPWLRSEAILLLHGNAESGIAWNGWMPRLARRLRVVRPDMRGYGDSTPMPLEYAWTAEGVVDDYVRLADRLGIERFHVAGAKIGGALAIRLAANHPDRVLTLSVMGGRAIGGNNMKDGGPPVRDRIERDGLESWARSTMGALLGSCSREMVEGWTQLQVDSTPLSTQLGFMMGPIPTIDIRDDLPKVSCPALVVMNSQSPHQLATTEQVRFSNREIVMLPYDSGHVAATHPDECAEAVLSFIDRAGA